MMAEPVKFNFDRDFSTNQQDGARNGAEEKKYTESEVEDIRDKAYQQGAEDARLNEQSTHTIALEQSIAQLLSACEREFDRFEQLSETTEKKAIMLARIIAERLAGQTLKENANESIENLLHAALKCVDDTPRIVVRTSPQFLDYAINTFEPAVKQKGLNSKVAFLEDEEMEAGDCKIEWSNGGIYRSYAELAQQVDQLIQDYTSVDINTPQTATNEDLTPPLDNNLHEVGTHTENMPNDEGGASDQPKHIDEQLTGQLEGEQK